MILKDSIIEVFNNIFIKTKNFAQTFLKIQNFFGGLLHKEKNTHTSFFTPSTQNIENTYKLHIFNSKSNTV